MNYDCNMDAAFFFSTSQLLLLLLAAYSLLLVHRFPCIAQPSPQSTHTPRFRMHMRRRARRKKTLH